MWVPGGLARGVLPFWPCCPGTPGALQAWKTALDLLPGRLMGTCRDLLRAGTGECKDGFEGKVVSEVSRGEARRKDHPGGRTSPCGTFCSEGLAGAGRGSLVQVHAQAHTLPGGVTGGHSGREKQEGRVQGWLQAGVQQAAACTREQVGGCLPVVPCWTLGRAPAGMGGLGVPGAPH